MEILNRQEVIDFQRRIEESKDECVQRVIRRFSHVQDGSKEMAEAYSKEAFENAVKALDRLLNFGNLPMEDNGIRAVIVEE